MYVANYLQITTCTDAINSTCCIYLGGVGGAQGVLRVVSVTAFHLLRFRAIFEMNIVMCVAEHVAAIRTASGDEKFHASPPPRHLRS